MDKQAKFYWHANKSSGGNLSIGISFEGQLSQQDKVSALADVIGECQKSMEQEGFIPHDAHLMSSSDISEKYGKSRQYWEKLISEGKIRYKETSAGRITTDLWIKGYLGNKEEVDRYVKNVQQQLTKIEAAKKRSGTLICTVCGEERFEYYTNTDNINGICRACGFYIHTTD
jgi:hypothetical protein